MLPTIQEIGAVGCNRHEHSKMAAPVFRKERSP
jgi:hypothetical protein